MNTRLFRLALTCAVLSPALLAQVPCIDPNLGADIGAADDTISQGWALGFTFTYAGVGYTDICIDPNGSIYLGASTTAAADWTPTEAEFLASPQPRIAPLWSDYNATAAGGGHIFYNAVAASGGNPAYALITWNGVYEYGTTRAIDLQIKLDATNGVTIAYGPTQAAGGTINTAILVGATPGLGAASNPVSFATRPVILASDNFAQVFTLPATTPSGFTMQWTPTSPGYVALDLPCVGPALATPRGVGCPGGVAGVALNAGDDTTHAVALPFSFPTPLGAVTDIVVSSNGFLTLGTVNSGSGCCAGSSATLLSGPQRISALWSDLNAGATGNGEVFAGLDNAGNFVVTWDHLAEYINQAQSTFQIVLSPSGNIEIRYGTVSNVSHTVLAGYSVGNGAADPGPTDLTLAPTPTVTSIYELYDGINLLDLSGKSFLLVPSGPAGYVFIPGNNGMSQVLPLALAAAPGSLPSLGTTFTMDVSGISAAPQGNAVILIIGFTSLNPGVDLGVIGAPGCNAYLLPGPSDLQLLNIVFGAPTTSFSAGVPNNTALLGATATCEAVSDDATVNAFGWKFSNGLDLRVGF